MLFERPRERLRILAAARLADPWQYAKPCLSVVFVLVLVFLELFGGSLAATAAAADPNSVIAAIGPAQSFAIGDFDGDGHPEIASVEAGTTVSYFTNYWIRLHLSTSNQQSIQVTAPAGGLLIEARDVNNGNHFIDLVLTTAWSGQPVAILINDGRGKFSRVEPTAYPEAFTEPTRNWVQSHPAASAFGIPAQPRPGIGSEEWAVSGVRPRVGSLSFCSSRFVPHSLPISHAGRAPPVAVSNL